MTCMFVPNSRMFGYRLSFSSLVHLPCWFIYFLRMVFGESAATFSMLHQVPSILLLWDSVWVLLATPVLIPGCLHTSLGLRLACWTISKPGGGHNVVVILWFVNCFVMDCLNSRLIKYWQLWQNARWSLSCLLCEFAPKFLTNQKSLEWCSSTIDDPPVNITGPQGH